MPTPDDATAAEDDTSAGGSSGRAHGPRAAAVRRRRGRRIAGVIGGLTVTALLGIVGAVLALDSSLSRTVVDGLASGASPDDGDGVGGPVDGDGQAEWDAVGFGRAVTVLVLGSDTRETLTPEERNELGTGSVEGERSDVMMLVRSDPSDGVVRILSLPRDLRVPLCNGSVGRINSAYPIGNAGDIGGLSCAVQTVTGWSGVPIDHVVNVDFRGFVDIVDLLGGVQMYIEEPLYDPKANLDLAAGCRRLDGADALGFVRSRAPDNDTGRNSRQQRMLVELRDEAKEAGVFGDPVLAYRLASSFASATEIDSTLTLNRLRQLLTGHRTTLQGDIEARTIPGTVVEGTEAWLLDPVEPDATELFTWLIEGDPDPEPRFADDGDGLAEADDEGDADGETAADGGTGSETSGDTVGDASADEDDAPVASRPQRC